MISLALFFIASCLNAAMDMLFNMWQASIFVRNPKRYPIKFWDIFQNIDPPIRIFGTRLDAWHVAKFLMLTCIIGAIYTFDHSWLIIVFPIVWGLGFEITKKLLTFKFKNS
jgi:hypothetical protein